MKLETKQIDASEFFTENDIILTCPTCKGRGERTVDQPPINVVKADEDTTCDQSGDAIEEGDTAYRLGDDTDHIFATEQDAEDWHKDNGDTESCPECQSGYLNVMWNTIWNTGFIARHYDLPADLGVVVAFEYEGDVWFGLAGCGMDLTPRLAAAWIKMFPDCTWLPEDFTDVSSIMNGWNESQVGKETADKIAKLALAGFKRQRDSAAYSYKQLNEFLKGQKKARKAKA